MKNKPLYIFAGSVLILALLWFGGKAFVYRKIRSAVLAQADSLRSKGFEVRFDSLVTNSWSNRISVSAVDITFAGKKCSDTTSRFSAVKVKIEGISLLNYLFHKKLKIGSISINKPFFRRNGQVPGNNQKKSKHIKIKTISIDEIQLTGAAFEVMDTVGCRVRERGAFDVSVRSLNISDPGTPKQKLSIDGAQVLRAKVDLPLSFYTAEFKSLSYDRAGRSIRIDSLNLLPWYDKITFVRKTGVQTDRVDLRIPLLEADGVSSPLSGSDTITVRKIRLAFTAMVFRDKRQPGGKRKIKKLLSRSIHDLKIPLQIDSVIVSESLVSYEEFQPTGGASGTVTFHQMKASIGNLSNVSPQAATMKAGARFMNAGNLNAFFTFPADPDKPYTIKGSLADFNLVKLNPMLIPAANAEVKKGHLQSMLFNLEYNDYRSDGQLTMNYRDLDVVSLLKNKDQKEENKFVTLILKSFVVKKDMDRSKSTGTILFYRDSGKATFNFWWKSILSGVKSLYNLDKITDTHHSKKK